MIKCKLLLSQNEKLIGRYKINSKAVAIVICILESVITHYNILYTVFVGMDICVSHVSQETTTFMIHVLNSKLIISLCNKAYISHVNNASMYTFNFLINK